MFLSVRELRSNKKDRKKRKFNDDSGINVPRKKCKHDTDTLPKSHQKDLSIEESIKRFHSDIAIGPLYGLFLLSPDMVQEKCFNVEEHPYFSRK